MKFSTADRDKDKDDYGSCAEYYNSAWWYDSCYRSDLNGLYINADVSSGLGMYWFGRVKRPEMKIRPDNF